MNTIPPPLPRRAKSLSRDALVMIGAVATICIAIVAWIATERWEEAKTAQRKTKELMILNNLRQLSAAADMFYLEHNTKSMTLAQIVGPGKYVKQLTPVDGEDYNKLNLNLDEKNWRVVSKGGITVSYKR